MRGFTAHGARGQNLPPTPPKSAQETDFFFCSGNLLFQAGELISVSHLGVSVTIVKAVKNFSVRKHSGFNLRFREKLCVGILHRMNRLVMYFLLSLSIVM